MGYPLGNVGVAVSTELYGTFPSYSVGSNVVDSYMVYTTALANTGNEYSEPISWTGTSWSGDTPYNSEQKRSVAYRRPFSYGTYEAIAVGGIAYERGSKPPTCGV